MRHRFSLQQLSAAFEYSIEHTDPWTKISDIPMESNDYLWLAQLCSSYWWPGISSSLLRCSSLFALAGRLFLNPWISHPGTQWVFSLEQPHVGSSQWDLIISIVYPCHPTKYTFSTYKEYVEHALEREIWTYSPSMSVASDSRVACMRASSLLLSLFDCKLCCY